MKLLTRLIKFCCPDTLPPPKITDPIGDLKPIVECENKNHHFQYWEQYRQHFRICRKCGMSEKKWFGSDTWIKENAFKNSNGVVVVMNDGFTLRNRKTNNK